MAESVEPTTPLSDLAIVGAGPIGIELAAEARRAGLQVIHLEAGQIGQTISWFPQQMHFFSSNDRIAICGIPIPSADQTKCTKEQYLAYLRMVVDQLDLDIRTYEPVTGVRRDEEGFTLHTRPASGERSYRARRIALAIGDTHEANRLGIAGEDLPHVSHYFVEPHRYFRRRLLIVGGKNSAVEAALRCHHAGAKVAISYRRSEFSEQAVKYWLLPELKGRIKRGEIDCHDQTVPVRIGPDRVTLKRLDTEQTFDVGADAVLMLVGYRADMSLLRQAGVQLVGERDQPVLHEPTMQTNIEGIYLAGTAIAGTQQSYQVFLENCHIHTRRIVAHITGQPPPPDTADFERQEI